MTGLRIFVSYSSADGPSADQSVAMSLMDDLRAAGAEVVADDESVASDTFVQTLNTELPTCQWLILVQTPAALHSTGMQMTVNTALNLVAQQRMQGVLRVIASPSDPSEVPAVWMTLNTFDAHRYYPGIVPKLLLTRGLVLPAHTDELPSQTALSQVLPATSPSLALDHTPLNLSSPSFRGRRRTILIVGLAVLALLFIAGSLLSVLLLSNRTHTAIGAGTSSAAGYVFFTSTGTMKINSSQGLDDGIAIDLSHVANPARGKSYYVWLLPDTDQQGQAVPLLLGQVPVQQGTIHFKYVDAANTNFLATVSRFLLSEADAHIPPGNPLLDKSTWRYYGEFSQVADPNDTTNHYSLLDHLRHLLVADPQLQKVSLQGGLNTWFLQNTRKVLEWTTAARGTGVMQPDLMHRHFVRILDYLDGLAQVRKDVPSGNPILADSTIAQVPLLTLDPEHQDPPGYIRHIAAHVQGLISAPGVTDQQRELARQILTALTTVGNELEQVRQDAIKLVRMTDAQLAAPTTVPLLDDLLLHANNAYVGQTDSASATRQGGATWIFDHIQLLATLTVTRYTA